MIETGGQPEKPEAASHSGDAGADARQPKPVKRQPERTCIVSRRSGGPADLVRFVVSPANEIVPDVASRLPGRGIWVTATAAMVGDAVRRKAFHRAARKQVVVPDDLAARVDDLMLRRMLEALSLANKAGQLVAGFSRVEAALASGKAACLLHATDAAADGVERLDRLYRAICRDTGQQALIRCIASSEQMSLALGRSNVVHCCLTQGGATRFFIEQVRRLDSYRGHSGLEEVPAPVAPDPLGPAVIAPIHKRPTSSSPKRSRRTSRKVDTGRE